MDNTADSTTVTREMGCTAADFDRWLPGATRHAPLESVIEAGRIRHRVTVGAGAVDIVLEERPPRRIAGIVLPVLLVSFRFIALDAAQRRAFLDYFDHYTRRGGG